MAHKGVLEEMNRYETGRYGDKPGRWEDTANEELTGKASANTSASVRPLGQLRQGARELGNDVVLERVPRR